MAVTYEEAMRNHFGAKSGLLSPNPNAAAAYEASQKATAAQPAPMGGWNAADQFYATQAGISGLGDAYGDRAAYNANALRSDTLNSNTDTMKQQRYQELSLKRDELKDKILKLESEISWQKSLKQAEVSRDPMWEMAKHDWIYKGDRSGLENIMQRMSTEKIAKASKDESKRGEIATYREKVDNLEWALDQQIAGGLANTDFGKQDASNIMKTIADLRYAETTLARAEGRQFNEQEFLDKIASKGVDFTKLRAMSSSPWTGSGSNASVLSGDGTNASTGFNLKATMSKVNTNLDSVLSGNDSQAIANKISEVNAAIDDVTNADMQESERQNTLKELNEAKAKLEVRDAEIKEGDKWTQLTDDFKAARTSADMQRILNEASAIPGHEDEKNRMRHTIEAKKRDEAEAARKKQEHNTKANEYANAYNNSSSSAKVVFSTLYPGVKMDDFIEIVSVNGVPTAKPKLK